MRSYYRISNLSLDRQILSLRSAGYEITPGKTNHTFHAEWDQTHRLS